MTQDVPQTSGWLPPAWRKAGRDVGVVGVGGLTVCLVIWILMMIMGNRWPEAAAGFYKGYLFAWLFFLSISLGAMMGVMIHHLTGGAWGWFVRRFGEAAMGCLPLLFVLFVPILIGLRRIYPWADPQNHDARVLHKAAYLNVWFFILRYILYFALWIGMAWILRKLSLSHDRTASKRTEKRLSQISAAGLLVYFLTMSLASVDWIMSLEPQWYSTVFGFIVCMSQGVVGICVMIIMLQLMSEERPFAPRIMPKYYNDLSTLLITAVILWAYNSFAQLLVIWMGNLQIEIPWYVARSQGPWRAMAITIIFVGFLAPFVLLLQRGVKSNGVILRWVCVGVLLTQLLDQYWWIAPSGGDPYPSLNWVNGITSIVSLIGIGGVWMMFFFWALDRAPLMPAGENVPIGMSPAREAELENRKLENGTESGQHGFA